MVDKLIGYGKFKRINGKWDYEGTLPNLNEGEEIKIAYMRSDFLDDIVKNETLLLLHSKGSMDESFYAHSGTTFPDEIDHSSQDGTKHRLFLDRHFYSQNPKDMIFIRYVNVDQSFIEEKP